MSKEPEVIVEPSLMSGLARVRAEQAHKRRKGWAVKDAPKDSYRAICPWCHAPNLVMSPIDSSTPMITSPTAGDVLQCDACRLYHTVDHVDGFKVKTSPLHIEL